MDLSEEARERLADIVELQPTKNADLQERWDMESGSEVHQYLEAELRDYYYRDEDSLVRATAEAADLVSDLVDTEDVEQTVSVTDLESKVIGVLAGPEERSESVVSVLHKIRDKYDADPSADEVRRALQRLKRKGVVTTEYRTVPTFRLATSRDELSVEVTS
ncbi:MAG: DUF5797 family protein [Halobacteriaceae archaeon]